MFYRFIKKMSPFIMLDCKLGRWKLNDNINRKIDLANIDNCGDRLCGMPISLKDKNTIYDHNIQKYNIKQDRSDKTIESIVLDYNRRWKQNITVKDFKDNFTNK